MVLGRARLSGRRPPDPAVDPGAPVDHPPEHVGGDRGHPGLDDLVGTGPGPVQHVSVGPGDPGHPERRRPPPLGGKGRVGGRHLQRRDLAGPKDRARHRPQRAVHPHPGGRLDHRPGATVGVATAEPQQEPGVDGVDREGGRRPQGRLAEAVALVVGHPPGRAMPPSAPHHQPVRRREHRLGWDPQLQGRHQRERLERRACRPPTPTSPRGQVHPPEPGVVPPAPTTHHRPDRPGPRLNRHQRAVRVPSAPPRDRRHRPLSGRLRLQVNRGRDPQPPGEHPVRPRLPRGPEHVKAPIRRIQQLVEHPPHKPRRMLVAARFARAALPRPSLAVAALAGSPGRRPRGAAAALARTTRRRWPLRSIRARTDARRARAARGWRNGS